jgi:hypothetical protein
MTKGAKKSSRHHPSRAKKTTITPKKTRSPKDILNVLKKAKALKKSGLINDPYLTKSLIYKIEG